MTALIITIHIVVCIALILIVLLQTGKGASMGAVFGGAGSQALFGNTGAASFLGKLTTWAAVIFMITSLALAYISKSGGKSVVSNIAPVTQQKQAPVENQQPIKTTESPASENAVPAAKPTPAPAATQPVVNQPPAASVPASSGTETPPVSAGKVASAEEEGSPAAKTTAPEQPEPQQPQP